MQTTTVPSWTPLTLSRTMMVMGLALLTWGLLSWSPHPAAAQQRPEACIPEADDAGYADADAIAEAHLEAVNCVTQLGIAQGLGSDVGEVFLPRADVQRGQMATFIAGTLTEAGVELPDRSEGAFEDVAPDDVHAEAIERLAAAGVVSGVTDDRYASDAPVRRDQMASFLIQALAYQAGVEAADLQGGETPFDDVDDDNVHLGSIHGAYHVGITTGTSAEAYSPDATVSRQAMASFVTRSLYAMQARQTVADRDGGALSHTVYTYLSEGGRCFQVNAGTAWGVECGPGTEEPLQLRTVAIDDDFAVLTGLVTSDVTRVEVEYGQSETIEVDLVATRSEGLRAWASPILRDDLDAVVAYADDEEVARIAPDDATAPGFPGDTDPSEGDGEGEPVNVTDIEFGHHQTFDRVVFEVAGGGHAGWDAEYVEEALAQGSSEPVTVDGAAILRLDLTNTAYPTETDVDTYEPETRLDGVDAIRELYVGTTFEGHTRLFLGLDARTPFRVFTLEDPDRVVVDIEHPSD